MDDSSIKKPNEKKYHLDMHYLDHPVRFGEISLIQLGRLHCTNHTVIDMHSHRNWFEITVATDGEGTIIIGNTEVSVSRGDIHLSFPGDFHGIRSDNVNALKYDFFAFSTESPFFKEKLEQIMQTRRAADQRVVRDEKIEHLIKNAIAEVNHPTELSDAILESIFRQILLYLIRDFQCTDIPKLESVGTPDEICYQVMHYIDTHIYTLNGLMELSEVMRYNYSYLSDLFSKVTGDTLQNYYQSRRLRAAQLLLGEKNLKLGEIANLLRYSSIYSFSRAFKDKFGVSPSDYRKELKK